MRFFEEIANRESRNEYEIVLYPEGLFYKAYDRSAYACISRIPSFKPSKKRIKYCAREMASIGFPAAALPKYFPTAPRPLSDGRVVIALEDRIDADACQMWKMSLPLKERRPRGSSKARAYAPVLGRNGRTGDLFVHPVDLLPDTPAACAAAATGAKQGAMQPVPATGGKGGVDLPHLRSPQGPGLRADGGPASGTAGMFGSPTGRDATTTSAMREYGATEALLSVRTEGENPARPTGGRGAADADATMALAAGRTIPTLYGASSPTGPATGPERYARVEATAVSEDFQAAMAVLRPAKRPKWLLRIGYKILGINKLPQETLPAESEAEALRGSYEAGAERADPATPGTAAEKSETTAAGEREARPKGCGTRPTPEVSGALPEQAGPTALRRDAAPACKGAGPRNETREQRVARLIREFRLEAATPVECLLFVADLKKEIDGYL